MVSGRSIEKPSKLPFNEKECLDNDRAISGEQRDCAFLLIEPLHLSPKQGTS
jgi:hypothetical protein